jgi:hypothetical protein
MDQRYPNLTTIVKYVRNPQRFPTWRAIRSLSTCFKIFPLAVVGISSILRRSATPSASGAGVSSSVDA